MAPTLQIWDEIRCLRIAIEADVGLPGPVLAPHYLRAMYMYNGVIKELWVRL